MLVYATVPLLVIVFIAGYLVGLYAAKDALLKEAKRGPEDGVKITQR